MFEMSPRMQDIFESRLRDVGPMAEDPIDRFIAKARIQVTVNRRERDQGFGIDEIIRVTPRNRRGNTELMPLAPQCVEDVLAKLAIRCHGCSPGREARS